MKIALAQLNFTIGDFDRNVKKIVEQIHIAKTHHADLIVFPELAVSGYPPRDFLDFSDFIDHCYRSLYHVADECKDIAAIIGSPTRNPDLRGKNLFNSALLISEGAIIGQAHKALLPNYDIFDEYRYFEPNRKFNVLEFRGIRIALTICEDIWDIGPDPLYVADPMEELSKQKPHILINIAASPFHWNQDNERNRILTGNAIKYAIPVVYVNHVGAQTELLFDGNSRVIDSEGRIALKLRSFSEDLGIVEMKMENQSLIPVIQHIGSQQTGDKTALIHDALIMGIQDYFQKMDFSKAILGLSGGIDSAVTLALAVKALGSGNVHAVLLPSKFSSGHSIEDALKLAENLGVEYNIISIEEAVRSLDSTMEPYFRGLPFNIAEENIQARIRAIILMAMANKFGYILLNTSNKSEAAVGYGTLYGDMCGGISVLGDVYKTDVYSLANYINRDHEIIPVNSIVKPPSAELRPGQKDSDSLPTYEILDKILHNYIESGKSPQEIIDIGFDKATVLKVLKMVNLNEWKRHQTPPILRVSSKAFGSGRRMPIVARYLADSSKD
jgi:NAD+ synthase (glutamine-hydrolysing)